MTVMIVLYILLLLLTLGYVGVNCFHLIKFRLSVPGDHSVTLLSFYLLVVASLIVGSIFLAIIAYDI